MSSTPKFKAAYPYQEDVLALPVADLDTAAQWYSAHFGMSEVERFTEPVPTVILQRDGTRIGFAVNGGDPAQDGAAILVSDIRGMKDELEAKGWLSEERLAEQALAAARGRYGPQRVLYALREKGVSDTVLERAASALKGQELEQARAVWAKRFGRPPADARERAKQARFLEGRGFSTAVIRRVLRASQDE